MTEFLSARVLGRGISPGGYPIIRVEGDPPGVLDAYPSFDVLAHRGHLVSFARTLDHLDPAAGRSALCLDCAAAASAAYEARSLEAW